MKSTNATHLGFVIPLDQLLPGPLQEMLARLEVGDWISKRESGSCEQGTQDGGILRGTLAIRTSIVASTVTFLGCFFRTSDFGRVACSWCGSLKYGRGGRLGKT